MLLALLDPIHGEWVAFVGLLLLCLYGACYDNGEWRPIWRRWEE